MKISELSIYALKPFVTGDDSPAPRMGGKEMVTFFNHFGIQDVYLYDNGGLPNSASRKDYAVATLTKLNGTPEFKLMIEGLVDSRRVPNGDDLAQLINEIIKHDGYQLDKTNAGIHKITGAGLEEFVDVEAYFQAIREQIIDSIKSAEFSIWVAMAWFTDKEIANEILQKHWAGLNVQVIVNDDENTAKYGLNFDTKGVEYYKISPSSPWGEKIMHNKFCIIDFKKVIHGSYNWTKNASYNNESITVTESRELAEDFSSQFIQLKNSYKNRIV